MGGGMDAQNLFARPQGGIFAGQMLKSFMLQNSLDGANPVRPLRVARSHVMGEAVAMGKKQCIQSITILNVRPSEAGLSRRKPAMSIENRVVSGAPFDLAGLWHSFRLRIRPDTADMPQRHK
jgi:hypothetical protein